jgi:hypothetical protein
MTKTTLSPRGFWLRIGWIAIRLLLVYWLVKQGSYFYYQGF